MHPIDTFALVGEVLSWIGLGIGIPALLVAAMIRLAEGPWERVDIAILERDDETIARWFVRGDFHERMLRASEVPEADGDWHRGYVRSRDASHMRLGAPVVGRLLVAVGAVFAGVGVIGFVVSLLPAFI